MHAAVRDYSGNWQTVLNSAETINPGTPYFTAMKWQLSGGNLNVWMYLNDSIYSSAPISNFKDFTGVMTAVGSCNGGTYQVNGDMEKFTYTKDMLSDSQIAAIRASASSSVGFSYDTLGRLTEKTVNTGSAAKTTSYTYLDGASGSTTTRVGTVNADGNTTSYAYDPNGNIVSKTGYGGDFQYHYNELNELIREDNSVLDKTIVYQYNSGGNIVSKSTYGYTTGDTLGAVESVINYSYDTVWKDKLTDYNDKQITYDQIGNPLTYDDWTFTWGSGRQMV